MPIFEAVGPLPHARLEADRNAAANLETEGAPTTTAPRKQPSRHVKCACATCAYVVRTAREWLDEIGPPHCPQHGAMTAEGVAET